MRGYKIFFAIFVFGLMYLDGVSCSTLSQGTVGREFYIGVPKSYTIDRNKNITLIITSTSANSRNGDVTVQVPYLNTNYTTSFMNSKKLEITISNLVIQSNNRQVERRGIYVKSSIHVSLLVVTSYNDINADASETFLAFPKTLLSNSYIVSSFNNTSTWKSEFLIVASEKNTTVNISNTRINPPLASVTMDTLDTYLFSSGQDLSGTIISSDKPIAVFSGHEAAGVSCNYYHYLVEQNLPTKLFDTTFLVPPLPPKTSYVVRIYGLEPYTHFKYDFSARNQIVTLTKPGEFYEIFHNYTPIAITSDKPVQVMIYSTCYQLEKNNDFGGSTMSIIPSINQYDNVYHFTIPSLFSDTNHYIAILTKDVNIAKELRLDGQNISGKTNEYNLTASGDNYFIYIYQMQPGTYKLETLNGQRFGAIVYGYGRTVEIAYSNILGLKVGGCEGLSTPVDGTVVMLNGTGYQSQVVYSCLQGYILRGSSTRTCHSSGQWSGVMPTCEPIDCGNLAAPAYGAIRTPNGTKYGNVAEYVCNHGYTVQGQRTRTCNAYGNWSGIDPRCEPVDCKALSAPMNGYVHTPNGTTFKHQAEYTCMAGYRLKGESVRRCNASGHWNGTTPTCDTIDDGLTCLKCTDVYHTNLCNTITRCPRGQVCYVEKFTTHNGEVKYNSGCLEGTQCGISKRSVNCIECCTSDLCNFGGCGSQGLPSRDQRGPLCYDCALTYNMTECGSISLCQPYEVCSIEKFDWGGLYDQYTTECKSRHCLTSKSIRAHPNIKTRSTPVCQQCCENDLCNSSCNSTVTDGNGLAIVG